MFEQIFMEEKESPAASIEEAIHLAQSEFGISTQTIALSTVKVDEDYRISWNGQWYPVTAWAFSNLLKIVKIPESFGLRIPRDLLADNIERLKQLEARAVIIFLRDGHVVNIVKDGYHPAKNKDVLLMLQMQASRWEVGRIRLSDRGMWLTLLDQSLPVIEPRVGDITKLALTLVNSETGGTGLKCSYSAYRLACLNGALVRDEWGSIRWNYDRRVKYETSLTEFENGLLSLSFQANALIKLYSLLPSEQLTDEEMVELWRAVARVVGPSHANAVIKIDEEERKKLVKEVRERWARNRVNLPDQKEKPVLTGFNAYDLFNEVTATARDASYPVARQLERIGGRLIEVAARRQ